VIFSKVNRFSERRIDKNSVPFGHALAATAPTASARYL
jgi:hypothetical protein